MIRFLPAGDRALLIELADLPETLALFEALQAAAVQGITEMVPAARTLLVEYEPYRITASAIQQVVQKIDAGKLDAPGEYSTSRAPAAEQAGRLVDIPVQYNGEDLLDVAEILGISVAELISRHTGAEYQAAFAGFAPGFVYLVGGHESFQIPRRQTPRTRVPAGSVAMAGNFSAVYPADSPGGWQLLGVTPSRMWDLARVEPALIQPGFRVRFRDMAKAAALVSLPSQTRAPTTTPDLASTVPVVEAQPQALPTPQPATVGQATAHIRFVQTGLQTLVQDEGRPGKAGMGVSVSGALDRSAMLTANQLVGNPSQTAVLENVLGHVTLVCEGAAVVAVSGAHTPMRLQSAAGVMHPVATEQAIALDDGDTLHIGAPTAGVRSYIAVRGGWHIEPVLGSLATDTLAQIGPAAIQAGRVLGVGGQVAAAHLSAVMLQTLPPVPLPQVGDVVNLDVVLGPRTDWFTEAAIAKLLAQPWTVTPASNRVGIRLSGQQPLERLNHAELPSEGTVTGAIQVPASGQPVLFLADHPLTGGYPVIAAVAHHHLNLAAQIPVGCQIQFHAHTPLMASSVAEGALASKE